MKFKLLFLISLTSVQSFAHHATLFLGVFFTSSEVSISIDIYLYLISPSFPYYTIYLQLRARGFLWGKTAVLKLNIVDSDVACDKNAIGQSHYFF